MQEITILGAVCDHPNIATLHEVWEDGNHIFMVMEVGAGRGAREGGRGEGGGAQAHVVWGAGAARSRGARLRTAWVTPPPPPHAGLHGWRAV